MTWTAAWSRIGDLAVEYDLRGRAERIGTTPLSYARNGLLLCIGPTPLDYDGSGRVRQDRRGPRRLRRLGSVAALRAPAQRTGSRI